ncbi:Alpha-glucan phosphorylase [Mesotoga infera]|jgi:starch phosphorylase|uniref:Alpha-glucan phosphorylase n=1 Tax=Mesotoga infera TaxID=1236046 RepID=A0A7Z7LE57_9BACT|nr:alpha-glucan family phosphorylase [Mesotoga infera]NLI05935.1 glycosyltransferase family 1 protein [Thermotogaceae bacterium]SSC11693.1 Alpha-glucan phosphorylase [Mesotoga infera]HOI35388.1 alpha-glucan family phosphorylase [Mesotoga infera]
MYFLERVMAVPRLPEKLARLEELARNLWWSWNYDAQEMFKYTDPEMWYQEKRSPVRLLRRIKQERLYELENDVQFLAMYENTLKKFDEYMGNKNTWLERNYPDRRDRCIAYFCAEYGFHESFPIYSGGLGILAGDHLKTASDMGLNFVAVGLLYRNGYFEQRIDESGWQQNIYSRYDFEDFPVVPALDENGDEVYINIDLPGRKLWAKIWRVQVGKTALFLLDTDIPQNEVEDRKITSNLYGGDREMRLKQEILLGIGGVRALRVMGINPELWHMNEGHAAFLSLERIREYVQGKGLDFATAATLVKSGNVFTTHTPVPAGNDIFDLEIIERYFRAFWEKVKTSREEFMELGLEKFPGGGQHYSMTVLALKLSAASNGVSELHGKVSRNLWNHIYPDLPAVEVPITHVTNGVHIWTWLNSSMVKLLDRYLPGDWHERVDDPEVWERVDDIPPEEIWQLHLALKSRTKSFLQTRLKRQRRRLGETIEDLMEVDEILPEDVLTIGFARRFATYKRATLIFKDINRLKSIISSSERPVQFVFAGKAHPADDPGKELIRKLYEISRTPEFKNRIIIVENYDMNIARHLVSGVDIWLNTPRRPHEASGTSGEKAGMNGVLNFSVMDGWWVEGYDGNNGWAIGDNRDYQDNELQDRIDSVSIYSTLEKEIVPLYYSRDDNGTAVEWAQKMKDSIKEIGKRFNTQRMLADYAEKLYFPVIDLFDEVQKNDFRLARNVSGWKEKFSASWNAIRIKPNIQVESTTRSIKVGQEISLSANVYLGTMDPNEVLVEIFVARMDDNGEMINFKLYPMSLIKEDVHGEYIYGGKFTIPEEGKLAYTIRVVPNPDHLPERYFIPLARWIS